LVYVEAHQTIVNIQIGSVVKQFQRTLNIDFQGGRYMVGFVFVLFQKGIILILKDRQNLRGRIVELSLVNLMHTT
ncbi:hypothetical protein NE479_12880, partial [Phascolarctobacterium faecium]